MKQFTVPTREQVSADNQSIFDTLKKALGMVPNLYATMAHSENGLSNYLAFQGAKTSLSNKEKEIVNLVVSEVNSCVYCQSAHTVIGKMNGFTDDEIIGFRSASALIQNLTPWLFWLKTSLNPKEKSHPKILKSSMLQVTMKVVL